MKKLVIIGCIALLLIIIAVFLRRPLSTAVVSVQPTNLVVTFVGFTNSPAGAQALFYFTNGTPRSLHFQITSADYKTESGWKSAPSTRGNRLVGSLDSKMGFTWPCDVGTTNTAWRLRISCVEQATGVSGAVDRGKEVVNKVKTGNPTHIFTGRTYEIVSSETEK